ncbi:MAG TPA: HAD-IA family hydrolase [Candidatus Moranbacteria bacterium]|nr:HAD-IA family hydrolase [Candidatus Moranbacteria bacterium]
MKTVIFDFDGTLADTLENGIKIYNQLAKKKNLPLFTKKEKDLLRTQTIPQLAKTFQIPLYKVPLIVKQLRSLMLKNKIIAKPFIGIKPTLWQLKKSGFKLGIISSNTEENIDFFLEQQDLKNLFSFVSSEKNIFGKDKKIKKVIKKEKLAKKKVVYIGDEVRDIEAAHKAGISVIAVTWGFNSEKILQKYQPTKIVRDPKEIFNAVEEVFG